MIDLVVNVNIDTQYIVINSNCNTLANSHVYKASMYSRYMQDILYTFTWYQELFDLQNTKIFFSSFSNSSHPQT